MADWNRDAAALGRKLAGIFAVKMKGRPTMQLTPQTASLSMPASIAGIEDRRQREDWVYQGFTVAAILMVLGSLWVF
jgi:hypothetical protein